MLSLHTVKCPNESDWYYMCRQRYNKGRRDCTNTCSMPAAAFEEAVWKADYNLLSDPVRLRRQHERHVERLRRRWRGDPDKESRELAEKLQKLERRRAGCLSTWRPTAT